MKIQVDAKILRGALKLGAMAMDRRTTIPVLGSILVDGSKFVTGNMEMYVTQEVDLKVVDPGKCCIPLTALSKVCDSLDGEIEIEGDDKLIVVKYARGKARLKTVPPENYPSIPALEGDAVPVDRERFVSACEALLRCVATEESRHTQKAVCFDGDRMVATDGYRMTVCEIDTGINCLASPQGLAAAVKLEGDLSLRRDDKHLEVRSESVSVIARTITGAFPDYKRVLVKIPDSAHLEPAEWSSALKRVAGLSENRAGVSIVKLSQGDGFCILSGDGVDGGVSENVPSDLKIDKARAYNAKFLSDGLMMAGATHIGLAEHTIEIWDESAKFRYVLMEIRI